MKLIVFILFLFIANTGFSTNQVPDYLILDSDTIAIFSNPLESYFNQVGERNIIGLQGCGSTACWRGYKAIWELKNDSLFLNAITSCHSDQFCSKVVDADLKAMFGSAPVFAQWFSGKILIPKGKLVQYIHMGYASIYEKELSLHIKAGRKKKQSIKSNAKLVKKIQANKHHQALSIKLQDTLFHYLKSTIDWEYFQDKTQLICDTKYFITFGKHGRVLKIKLAPWADTKIENWWWDLIHNKCKVAIKKALNPLDLSYLNPNNKFYIQIEIFYNSETKTLELWKAFWMRRAKDF